MLEDAAGIRRVVIACYHQHRYLRLDPGDGSQKLIKDTVRLPGRDAPVKNIPADQQRIRVIFLDLLHHFSQDLPLVLPQAVGIELLSNMQV